MANYFKPELTFPEEVCEFVQEAYESATCILEYGSGGSTVLASEKPGKRIFSVESDKEWAANLVGYVKGSALTKSMPEIVHIDIGKTKEWGHPVSNESFSEFYRYPTSVWSGIAENKPDIVLIDGRFRLSCFLFTIFQ